MQGASRIDFTLASGRVVTAVNRGRAKVNKEMCLEDDLKETDRRMDKLRESYMSKLLKGQTTRAQTTTYNARMGQLADRRDHLRKEMERE